MFTKQEGFYLWIFMVMIGLLLLILDSSSRSKKSFLTFMLFIFVPLIFLIPWFSFKSTFVLSKYEKDWSLSQFSYAYIETKLHRIKSILRVMKNTFFIRIGWNIIWIIFFSILIIFPKRNFKIPIIALPLLIFINIIAVFTATLLYPWYWWGTFLASMHRLLMLNIPLIIYFISSQLYDNYMQE